MSLITRCPACATHFKVAPEQLKLSDGWVRCGHCSDVFDATRYLETRAPGATQPKPSGTQQTPAPSSPERPAQQSVGVASSSAEQAAALSSHAVQETATPLSFETDAIPLHADDLDSDLRLDAPDLPMDIDPSHAREARPSSSAPVYPATAEPLDRDATDASDASDFHIELQRFAAGQGKPPAADPVVIPADTAASVSPTPQQKPLPAAHAQQQNKPETGKVAQPPDAQESVAAALEPGFVRQARQRAFWRSPGVRVLLALVALLLSALLAAQWVLQERDRLAARHPAFQPLLASLCEPLGCTIGAVRDLQAVVIDSSTLTRRLGDFYSFDLVLKNTASTALAVPALELSLTDSADTVISRRVFLPDELPGVPPLLPPQSTVPIGLRLSLAVGTELPMTGYRALVFYP